MKYHTEFGQLMQHTASIYKDDDLIRELYRDQILQIIDKFVSITFQKLQKKNNENFDIIKPSKKDNKLTLSLPRIVI